MLPARRVDLETEEADALSAAQPERRRQYVQTHPGRFAGAFRERSDGVVAVGHERWSTGMRVRCGRPGGYVVFSLLRSQSAASCCGIPIAAGGVLELNGDWEMTTAGPLEGFSFGVDRGYLERTETLLDGGREPRPFGNRLLGGSAGLAGTLREQVVRSLASRELPVPAQRGLQAELVYLAVSIRRQAGPRPSCIEARPRSRATVRRVEGYLDAHERELPSLAELCAIAGVAERTLEYAFREQLGLPPGRYLRRRRLNHVRSELRAADPESTRVTDVAMRWGFWQLGRFASEYRELFGERPSETLSRPARSG